MDTDHHDAANADVDDDADAGAAEDRGRRTQ